MYVCVHESFETNHLWGTLRTMFGARGIFTHSVGLKSKWQNAQVWSFVVCLNVLYNLNQSLLIPYLSNEHCIFEATKLLPWWLLTLSRETNNHNRLFLVSLSSSFSSNPYETKKWSFKLMPFHLKMYSNLSWRNVINENLNFN